MTTNPLHGHPWFKDRSKPTELVLAWGADGQQRSWDVIKAEVMEKRGQGANTVIVSATSYAAPSADFYREMHAQDVLVLAIAGRHVGQPASSEAVQKSIIKGLDICMEQEQIAATYRNRPPASATEAFHFKDQDRPMVVFPAWTGKRKMRSFTELARSAVSLTEQGYNVVIAQSIDDHYRYNYLPEALGNLRRQYNILAVSVMPSLIGRRADNPQLVKSVKEELIRLKEFADSPGVLPQEAQHQHIYNRELHRRWQKLSPAKRQELESENRQLLVALNSKHAIGGHT